MFEIIFHNSYKSKSKVGDCSWSRPEGSLFNSYYTEGLGWALNLSLDCSTLPSIHTLYCLLLSKEVSSTILKVFGMTRPRIEARSPGTLANTLPKLLTVIVLILTRIFFYLNLTFFFKQITSSLNRLQWEYVTQMYVADINLARESIT